MATVFSHAIVATSLVYVLPLQQKFRTVEFLSAAALLSIVPDLDVISFKLGIRYEDFWGHRGFTHSLAFALICGLSTSFYLQRGLHLFTRILSISILTLAMCSHGLLDALTNGGLGIALFSPFYNDRFFFPIRPIAVSSIGFKFFSYASWYVILSEIVYLVLPSMCICSLVRWRRSRQTSSQYQNDENAT